MKIVLASGSPRRRELLEQIGAKFEVRPSRADETITGSIPSEMVKELALRKGREVAGRDNEEAVILSADTIVSHEGKILGKPEDDRDAVKMIANLQGKSHEVYTGVAIIIKRENTEKVISFAVETKVRVAPMSMEEIEGYIRTGEHKDKAGAYAIQGKFAPYIEQIEGDYYNVVGFPISKICRELKKEGIHLLGYS